jgi:hypothetical protein
MRGRQPSRQLRRCVPHTRRTLSCGRTLAVGLEQAYCHSRRDIQGFGTGGKWNRGTQLCRGDEFRRQARTFIAHQPEYRSAEIEVIEARAAMSDCRHRRRGAGRQRREQIGLLADGQGRNAPPVRRATRARSMPRHSPDQAAHCGHPAAAAVRRIAPTLPASCNASSSTASPGDNSAGACGMSITAAMPVGAATPDNSRNRLSRKLRQSIPVAPCSRAAISVFACPPSLTSNCLMPIPWAKHVATRWMPSSQGRAVAAGIVGQPAQRLERGFSRELIWRIPLIRGIRARPLPARKLLR